MSLKEKILLVNLNISQWGARKLDRKVSKEVTDNHNAASNAARVTKSLLGDDVLKDIIKCSGAARDYHTTITLPWGDDKSRVLLSAKYFEYISKMNEFKQKYEDAVDEFVFMYPDLRQKTEWFLGSMFNANDYPDIDIIKSKFRMKVTVMPVSDASDFRIKMSDDEVTQIREDINAELENRIQTAMNDILDRAREVVRNMAEALADPNKIFRDTLIGNVTALAETIPSLNFVDDKHVNEVCELLKSLNYDPETLRWKLSLRKEVAKKAEQILNMI